MSTDNEQVQENAAGAVTAAANTVSAAVHEEGRESHFNVVYVEHSRTVNEEGLAIKFGAFGALRRIDYDQKQRVRDAAKKLEDQDHKNSGDEESGEDDDSTTISFIHFLKVSEAATAVEAFAVPSSAQDDDENVLGDEENGRDGEFERENGSLALNNTSSSSSSSQSSTDPERHLYKLVDIIRPDRLGPYSIKYTNEPEDSPPRSRLFVVCPKKMAEAQLEEAFRRAHAKDLEYCKIITDRQTNQSKGFAYVKFFVASSAARAMEEIVEQGGIEGMRVKVLIADPKCKNRQQGGSGSVGSLNGHGNGVLGNNSNSINDISVGVGLLQLGPSNGFINGAGAGGEPNDKMYKQHKRSGYYSHDSRHSNHTNNNGAGNHHNNHHNNNGGTNHFGGPNGHHFPHHNGSHHHSQRHGHLPHHQQQHHQGGGHHQQHLHQQGGHHQHQHHHQPPHHQSQLPPHPYGHHGPAPNPYYADYRKVGPNYPYPMVYPMPLDMGMPPMYAMGYAMGAPQGPYGGWGLLPVVINGQQTYVTPEQLAKLYGYDVAGMGPMGPPLLIYNTEDPSSPFITDEDDEDIKNGRKFTDLPPEDPLDATSSSTTSVSSTGASSSGQQ